MLRIPGEMKKKEKRFRRWAEREAFMFNLQDGANPRWGLLFSLSDEAIESLH